MLTEVYHATYVPSKVPEFVDPHVTWDSSTSFLFEANPNHPALVAARVIGLTTITALENYGFKNVELVYRGERPDF